MCGKYGALVLSFAAQTRLDHQRRCAQYLINMTIVHERGPGGKGGGGGG